MVTLGVSCFKILTQFGGQNSRMPIFSHNPKKGKDGRKLFFFPTERDDTEKNYQIFEKLLLETD